MRHGLPSASGMLFSLVLAASTVQAYGFRPDNQRTLIAGFDDRASCHPFKPILAAQSLLCGVSRQERGKLWPRVCDVWRGQCAP